MDITISLAQLWGPALLAIGIGFFTSRQYYLKIYRDLQNETLAVLIFAMAGIAAGIAQIQAHNVWGSFTEGLVSFLGWGLLLKGAVFAIMPSVVDKIGDWEADHRVVPFAGALVIIIGAYLTWFGFLA